MMLKNKCAIPVKELQIKAPWLPARVGARPAGQWVSGLRDQGSARTLGQERSPSNSGIAAIERPVSVAKLPFADFA
jgi:hypothetical protein